MAHALDNHPCFDSKLCKGDADRTDEERQARKELHIFRMFGKEAIVPCSHRMTGLRLYLVRLQAVSCRQGLARHCYELM